MRKRSSSINLAAIACAVQVVLAKDLQFSLSRYYISQHTLVQEVMMSSQLAQNSNIVFSPESINQAKFVDSVLLAQMNNDDKVFYEKVFAAIIERPKVHSGRYVEYRTLNRIFYDPAMEGIYRIGKNGVGLGVSSEEMDFSKHPDLVRSYVNNIVARTTNNLIPNYLDTELNSNTKALLVNVIYFKAAWQMPFDVAMTQNAPFETPNGYKKSVAMLNGNILARHIEYENADVIEIPYNATNALSMIILLPKDRTTDLRRFVKTVNFATVSEMLWDAPQQSITLSMPKLDIKTDFDLKSVTKIKLQHFENVKHNVRLLVDERGTEGAAATGGGASRASFNSVVCDHPYLFAVYNNRVDSIVFFGAVVDP